MKSLRERLEEKKQELFTNNEETLNEATNTKETLNEKRNFKKRLDLAQKFYNLHGDLVVLEMGIDGYELWDKKKNDLIKTLNSREFKTIQKIFN